MLETGKVQLEPKTDVSFVAHPPSPDSFKAASKGSVYVEFDVDASYLRQGGNVDWKQIIGPNSAYAEREKVIGKSNIVDFPDATGIQLVGRK